FAGVARSEVHLDPAQCPVYQQFATVRQLVARDQPIDDPADRLAAQCDQDRAGRGVTLPEQPDDLPRRKREIHTLATFDRSTGAPSMREEAPCFDIPTRTGTRPCRAAMAQG